MAGRAIATANARVDPAILAFGTQINGWKPQLSAKLTDISAKLDAIFGRFEVELRRAA
jgi:hypothetical protein